MRDKRKYEELFPDEFAEEVKRCPIIYCAFGPMEYHCPHNTLGIDPRKAYEICLRAAAISGGVVFPMVPVAPGGSMEVGKMSERDGLKYRAATTYPSVFTSVSLCAKLYYELFETFADDLGFKVCVAFGGHGPAGTLIKHINDTHDGVIKGMRLLPCWSLSHNMDLVEEEYKLLEIGRINHGGMWESAMFMAGNPEFVNPEKLKNAVPGPYEKYMFEKHGSETVPTYEEISKVSVEFGERLVRTTAERVAADALKTLAKMGHDTP